MTDRRPFELAELIARGCAELTWRTKAEVCVRHLTAGAAALRVAHVETGLSAIKSGDPAKMELWLAALKRREDAIRTEAAEAVG